MLYNDLKAAASKMMSVSVVILIVMNLISLVSDVPKLEVLSNPALRNILYIGIPVFFFIALKGELTAEKKSGQNAPLFKKLLILLGVCVAVFVLALISQMILGVVQFDTAQTAKRIIGFVSKLFSYASFLGIISVVLYKTEKKPEAVNTLCLITAIIAFAYLPLKLVADVLSWNQLVYVYTGKTALVNAYKFLTGAMPPLMYAQYAATLIMLILRKRHYAALAAQDELLKNQGQTVPDEIPEEDEDD
ncbi:MAG: hypothetical protein GX851_05130 [Clostridiales bacterium]|jgi:hypothetical protein|nr:hypothetical protein [Clostridiales bacterium]